jgi:outer membrane protein OmpA-like peptidoglycan-associated protein
MVSAATNHSGSTSATRVSQRRWIRRDLPVWPFVWRGLLPVLGLLIVAAYAIQPFARQVIEANVLRETRAQLAAQGYAWATVDVSGQNVSIGGVKPAGVDAESVLTAARTATCPSWAGRLICAVSVRGDFSESQSNPAPSAPEPQAKPEAKPEAKPVAAQACEKSLADLLMPSKIEFATSSAVISAKSEPLLDSLARAAGECPGVIVVAGHTDSLGSPAANRTLSEARAQSVRSALTKRGVPAERLRAEGFGADKPIADNTSAAGRAQNRRIEFRVATGN